MNRLGAIALMILILMGTMGNHLSFSIQKNRISSEIKRAIKNGVPDEELHILHFQNGKEPVWVKPGKEFRYGDHLYDVVRKETEDGSTVYHCIDDVQEKTLFAGLGKLINRSLGDPFSAFGFSLNSALNVYIPHAEVFVVHSEKPAVALRPPHFIYHFSLITNTSETEVPPPDFT